ncbi:MAG: hypothetical protein KatS3mg050_0077 [Litorilinea sp.]|nr:MAG: hypothetical protein KatS3mg050_0077 [Litorilinea sp.]
MSRNPLMGPPERLLPLILLVLAVVGHGLLWLPVPLLWQALAALAVVVVLPGLLLALALLPLPQPAASSDMGGNAGPEWPGRWLGELLVYGIALGYGLLVVGMTLLSYWPGGVTAISVLLLFDGLTVCLAAWAWRRWKGTVGAGLLLPGRQGLWLWGGLLVVAAFLRMGHLGYAEYHGDEARAVLRAAAVLQGYEDVLFLHKKGPAEIVIPAALFALTGRLTEAAARLPFALAGLAALGAVWLLGRQLFNPRTAWIATWLLAVDGYLIGFSRIVQYQSLILLTTPLVLLSLHRLVVEPRAPARRLTLAALMLATGLLAHYEAVWAAIPAAFLLAHLLWPAAGQSSIPPRIWVRALAVAVAVGGAVAASFYVPFIFHPRFTGTITYLLDRRIGGDSLPYNNLADFFGRTTVYSSTYYLILLVGLALIALLGLYRRSLGRAGSLLAGGLAVAALLATFHRADWLTVGGVDWTFAPFLIFLALAWTLPRVSVAERTLWLWLGVPFVVTLFFMAKPRTHVYVFFPPWALLAAYAAGQGWQQLRGAGKAGQLLRQLGAVAGAGLLLAFVNYAYWYFVHTDVEILRTWQENRPQGYWTAYDVPDNRALFGFPLNNGWKVVGMLYREGILQGDYATNEVEFWTPAWYTRGQRRCEDQATWFFRIQNFQPDPEGYDAALDHFLEKDFRPWARVTVKERPAMVIYRRSAESFPLRTYRLEEYEPLFDAQATPDLPLGYPVVEPPIGHPLHVNLGNRIWLEGYDLDYTPPLEPGEVFHLTLYWRAQQSMDQSYKVFNQSYYGDGVMVAQQDGYPVCGSRGTWLWDPGELVVDVHDIQVKADAPPGLYPLYTGLYIEETLDRLPVLDEAGNPVADRVHLTDIRIEAGTP